MKIGIYGGTFNPPHRGHLVAARAAIEALALDKLLLVPTQIPPHKQLAVDTPVAEHRLAMSALGADSMRLPGQVEVCPLELERKGLSYTADTLRALRQVYPHDELWLLMGSDMFLTLQDWHEPEEITNLANLATFVRQGEAEKVALEQQREMLEKAYGAKVSIIENPQVIDISSSALRQQIAQGGGQAYLPIAVYGYILMHGLYGTKADLKHLSDDELRACSYSMVKAKRHPHIGGVESESVKLAQHWGCDVDEARRAAILHDCTKYLLMEEHLELCEKYEIALDEVERNGVKLLHAKTGSAIAVDVFGASEAVAQAILYHTTGRANMCLLEKVLYLADYMEPNRKFEGVEELRQLSYTDLDAAALMGCEMSVEEMEAKGRVLHHNTLEARNWLLGMKG